MDFGFDETVYVGNYRQGHRNEHYDLIGLLSILYNSDEFGYKRTGKGMKAVH
ncbi:hypothetical protein GCM10028807_38550 [Spirosoma daeguense]